MAKTIDQLAEEYAKSTLVGSPSVKKNAFKAGAMWQKNQLPKWKKTPVVGGCWSDEIAVHPSLRLFRYEHYVINADKLFELLSKEE